TEDGKHACRDVGQVGGSDNHAREMAGQGRLFICEPPKDAGRDFENHGSAEIENQTFGGELWNRLCTELDIVGEGVFSDFAIENPANDGVLGVKFAMSHGGGYQP